MEVLEFKNTIIEIKYFKRMRRQTTDWEQIFAEDTADKGLLSKNSSIRK